MLREWIKNTQSITIDLMRLAARGRPCKTWTQLISNDLRKLKLQPGWAQDYWSGEKPSEKPHPTHASMGRM